MQTRHTFTAVALMFGLGLVGSGTALAQTSVQALGEEPEDALTTRDYSEQRVMREDQPVATVNFDQDEDTYVTREEMRADYEASFDALDLNDDGVITEDEWTVTNMEMADFDVDADQQVTREEFTGYGDQAFDQILAAEVGGEEPEEMLTTRDYAEQRVMRDQMPVSTINLEDDEDGLVTRDEARADYEEAFQALDADGDGVITEEEWDVDADMAEFDEDADDQITREEFLGRGEQKYEEALGIEG